MKDITIKLSNNEALVLFEFLYEMEGMSINFAHPSEETVLQRILGQLEENLTEPLDSNYLDLLNRARNSLE